MADGDDSFEAFVRSRWPALVRSAYCLTLDQGKAEDLVQVALVKLWRHWERIRDQDPRGYVHRILVTTAISQGRRHWNREITGRNELAAFVDDATASVADQDLLRRALAVLPIRQRAVLVLRFGEDFSERQVAELMDCSVGSVKSQASRGLRRLREMPGLGFEGLIEEPSGCAADD